VQSSGPVCRGVRCCASRSSTRRTGKVLWQYETEAQVLAGLVPTKSGLLFAGDVNGSLLVFDARKGDLLKTIHTGGALNHGLISYEVGGKQYVAAAVGPLR
jgi:outer membrane protein assembly factor BamB